MIKLYYSPSFVGECYRNLPEGGTRFEKIVGDAGLLDFLELRLGLPEPEANPIERILAYKKALDAMKEGAFYKVAFENDGLATAKEILRWRDLLVMEGFEANTPYDSPRLQKLAEVEREFRRSAPPGTPEKWKAVYTCIMEGGKVNGVEIIVHFSMNLLPKLIRETLSALGFTQGRYDGLELKDKVIPLNLSGKKISIWNFGTVAEAYRWGAELSPDADMAIICPDPLRLNAALRNCGSPLVESSAGGDSSIIQYFRLGLSLLERPVNIKNLLEYLRLGFSPIPPKQRFALARALKSENGRGEKWREALSRCNDVPEVQDYLGSLLDDMIVKDGMVASTTVTDWCEKVAKWKPSWGTTPQKIAYLAELKALCGGMCRVIQDKGKSTIEVDFVLKALKTLYEPRPVPIDKPQEHSLNVVDSHRSFIDAPGKLIWLPCNNGLGATYPYSFLQQEEMDELKLKTKTDYVRYDFNLMATLLAMVKEIDLCVCDFDCGEPLGEHPAVTLCKDAAKKEDLHDMHVISSTTSTFAPLHTAEIGVDLFPKQDDEQDLHLSATSMETLFGYPFDFVMEKTLGFMDISTLQLSDIILTQGTVAHYVFEHMLKDSGGSIGKMRDMVGNSFEERMITAAKEKGEILFQPENQTLFYSFKETLRKSINVLLDILEESRLQPIACEEPLNGDLPGIGHITGSVDFYAETEHGEIVVIDFKYSNGSQYIKKLVEDCSVQLEVYAEGLQKKLGKIVVDRGYYFFPLNQLHTYNESGVFKGSGVVPYTRPKTKHPLEKRIQDSVAFRKTQLRQGTLEMEEGTPLDEIAYQKQALADKNLIDLPKDPKNSKIKASSPFATPTKYPILKNAIK